VEFVARRWDRHPSCPPTRRRTRRLRVISANGQPIVPARRRLFVLYLVNTHMATVTGQQPTQAAAVRSAPWVAIAWFAALIVAVYFPVFRHLVGVWSSDDDMGHGFFVPLVAGYLVWQRRERLLAVNWKPAWWGIAIVLLGVAESYVGTLGAEQFLQGTAPLVTLVECC